jgi:hypothetical protein
MEPVNLSFKTVKIDPYVGLFTGFPAKIGVGVLADHKVGDALATEVCYTGVAYQLQCILRSKALLVTGNTVATAQFKPGENVLVLHKTFLVYTPCDRGRWKITKLVVCPNTDEPSLRKLAVNR